MSKIDTNFVKQLYSQAGVELTPEKLNHISNNYTSNEELESAFNLKYNNSQEPKTDPEKKNSVSIGTSKETPSESPTQQPRKKPTSAGEKPKKTGASASSAGKGSDGLIGRFGFKDKEEQKKAGVEASKIKVDAKTPSAVKPVSVKEEQFIKPELQKIQEEVSSPEFKKELEENKESILSKEQRGLASSGIDSSIEMKQAEGLLPPTSELIKSGDIKLDIYSGGQFEELLKPQSFTEKIAQQSKPFDFQIKESSDSFKVNYDNLMLSKDYNLKYPYLYYSNSKNGGDIQVNELYTNNLSSLPINKDDFDGFLRKKGLLDDFNKDLSSGLYNEDRGTFSENYNAKLIKEKRLVDFLSMYIYDRNQRDYDKRVIEYKKENPKATTKEIEENVSKFTFVSDQQFNEYIKNTFPTYTKSVEERKAKEKQQWEETKKNKGDFFSWQTLKKFGSGLSETISNRVSNLSSTVYDLIGMENTAKQIRFSAEEDAFERPENRDISYVSGKKVVYNGNEYLVDANGQIYDYNLKKRVTDLFTDTDYKSITKASEKGEDDNLFSWTGVTVQTTNVLADLALQIALTRGAGTSTNIIRSGLSKEGLAILSKVPVSQGMASSAIAQTFLGYSEGLEGTLVAAKNAGISDSEAKALANDAAMKTAGLYLVTYGISPQTKATFVKQKNEIIKEAIDVYAKKGKAAYVKFLNNRISGLKEFIVEGGKETGQELIQTAGTVYGVNQSINEQTGQEILQSEMTDDEVISMLPSTFIAGGIPIMLRNIGGAFSRKDYLSNLDVASNNVDLSNKRLDELLSNNVITPEEHSKSKEDLRVYSQNKNKIPKDTSAEIVLDVAKGLDEISKLESQKQNLDKAFHSDIDEKIEKKREEIKDLYKKDKENESNKQTTGQVSEQEKPATTNEAEGVVATQTRKETKPQEEVDRLRAEEIKELTESVDNPQDFITDGKVDANKIAESDNAKAKEIYAKYDAQIKPLLDNIKSETDAVQKPTEQSQEKVNTKISDTYTSNEVERVKALPTESVDGATMNLDGSKYEGGGLVIPLASKNMNASELTTEAIQSFVDENAESVGADNVKVGIYKFPNSNQVSIDINIVADPSVREEAITIGKELGQESLFDLDTFENVKTGADGMNPKKLTPSEFRAIQERLKPKSKGIEVSKDINQAKKQVSSIADKKIAKSVLNGVKAISKILSNVKVIIHDTDDSFRSVSGESKNQESSGLYQNGEIHINLAKANARTVAHEIFHAILLDKVKTDANAQTVTKKMIESISSKIDGNPDLKAKLEDFASMYDENIQDEEKLAELVGIMAQNYDSFSTRVKEIIKNWLNNLAKSFGVELFESNEVFDVLNTIAKKVATGSEITVENISTLDNGTNPIGGPTEIRIPKKRESKIDFKDSYENSLVTPNKKVDIYSLLEDIVDKKQKVWFWVADQLGINKDLGIDGGPSFAHQKEGDIWASSTSTTDIQKKINESEYIFIISGSPQLSKLFNKKVFDLMTSKLGDYKTFKENILSLKPTKDIKEVIEAHSSWDSLRKDSSVDSTITTKKAQEDLVKSGIKNPTEQQIKEYKTQKTKIGTGRKKFLNSLVNIQQKPNTAVYKYISSINGHTNVNDLRDGFYKDNGFEQNDIMLVLKPTGVRAGSDHSTYENTVEGEVIGVPDAKINALEVMPKEMADKYSGKASQASQAIAPYGSGVKEISTIPSKRQQKTLPLKVAEKLTEDGDGNFVFKHYSNQKRDVIKTGQGNNAITSREEASALSAVGGLAMFYTMEGQKETGVGNVEHNILVPMDKVYDIDSDPLGFEGEARKRFNEVRPGQAFTNNHRGAFITQIANENGFDIAVTQWRGSELRAQSTKELTPSEKSVEFKERPLETFKDGDYAIIDGRESLITNVDGNKLRYESLDGLAKGTTINNERNRRSIIKIDKPSVRMQKPSNKTNKEKRQELSDAKKEIQSIFSAAKEALKIEKDRNKVIDGLKKNVNRFIKSAIQDLEAGDIGKRAISSIISKVQGVTDKNFEEKLLEVNEILDNLYTNRDVNKAKADSKNAYSNVMSGNVGKLDKEGDMDKVMSSKVVGLTMLDPNILKKVLSDEDFSQYKDYINRLAERSLAIKETDLKAINELYDRIIGPYTDHVSEVNRIQQIIDAGGTLSSAESKFVEDNKSEFSERETPESIAEKEAKKADRDAKKQADIAEKKRKIKEFLPFISDVFASSIAEKGSIEWDILENLSNLTDEDIESMPENMLNNVFNALNSMVYNDVLVSYANEIHKYKLKQDHKKTFTETLSKAGKKGIYKAKLIKPLLKIREVIGLPMSAIWKGIKNGNLKQEIIDRRIKFFNFSSIDAAVKVYGETPIFNNIMSRFGKAMARVSSAEEKAETILLKVKKDLDKKSKNPQESYMKIVYHLIDAMAKNNVGSKSEVSAMEYFEATLSDPNSKIAENNRAKELIQAFVNKVKANSNEIDELSKEEINAVNAIRKVLDDNKINAYEANFFQNSNASPMINAYYPVMNSLKNQAEQDLVKLKNRFGISNVVSIKSGNLEEKTGTVHPIDMNPFSTAFSSIKSTIFQHQLRTEYQALKQALSELEIENTNNKEVLSYLSGIKKAVDSQFELLTNGVVGTEQTLADDILNAMDKSFYTLALGSVVSRGVDFLGNMVQLAAISPKILANNRRVLNNLLAIKKDDESGTEILRNFYKNAEASEINKMISSKKISTERTEFMNRGANRGVLSKGLPSSNLGTKIKARITDPITSATSSAVDLLLGFGDVKPYGMSWNGVFYEEFKKQAGVEVDVEKIARGDVEYLKRYKDAIKKASNKANQENADLYGSTNPMEKKVGIMEIAKKPVKSSLAGAIGALRNKAAYLFSSFDMNARNAINTSINTYIENQDSREARKLIGGAVRLAMYSASISYITSALWNAFKGDDDDEDELKKSFDKLSDNDDFIKYVNSSLLDFPIQKDAEGNIIQLNIDDLARYNEMRDKLMSNKEFAKAYDIMYGYLNRDLFDIQVRSKVNQINQGNYEYDRSVVDGFFTDIDNGFGKSGEDIIEVLGILNSEQGYKMFTQEEIDGNILKVEEYMSKIDFLNNRAIRESGGAIDRLLITKVASTLSDYRTDASAEDTSVTEGLKILMGMMFSRSNNFGKAAANYSAEFANKLITESKRGERGYDVYKDGIFQSPVKYKLKEDASLIDDAVNVLFPVFQKFDKYRYSDYSLPDLIRFTPMGILGVNDLAKINSKMKNDVIYQETNGKYKENILKDISKTKIDILRDKKKLEKDSLDEQFKKSRVIPGVDATRLKSRFPSYSKDKDLKVNGNRAN